MLKQAWDSIESLYHSSIIDPAVIAKFQDLKTSQTTHTKKEGNPLHYCSFFLPYDKNSGKIYLGYHIKADDWIPPGGHIEPGETPLDAAIREMQEELQTVITPAQIEPWNLSVKPINRPESGCVAHYDVWHLVHLKERFFEFDPREYHDAGWFTIPDGIAKIRKNPDFAALISILS